MNIQELKKWLNIIESTAGIELRRSEKYLKKSDEKVKECLGFYLSVMRGFLDELQQEIDK